MLPPRSDYSQEHCQRKRQDPHDERMWIESKISEDFPSWRIKHIGRKARADCQSIVFEAHDT